jgi:hypothetical protein
MKLLSISIEELTEALNIFQKYSRSQPEEGSKEEYGNINYSENALGVEGYNKKDFKKEDLDRLKALGFSWEPRWKGDTFGVFVGRQYKP